MYQDLYYNLCLSDRYYRNDVTKDKKQLEHTKSWGNDQVPLNKNLLLLLTAPSKIAKKIIYLFRFENQYVSVNMSN